MTTTLYDPTLGLASSSLGYVQLPTTPVYPSELATSASDLFLDIPNLLESAVIAPTGITLDTDGTPFNGIAGVQPILFLVSDQEIPTGNTLVADANTGYVGLTNYTIAGDFENLTPGQLLELQLGTLDIEDLFSLEPVDPAFPELNPTSGFTLSFDLTILNETSASDRAGFSLLVVTSDPTQEIELGFKTEGDDRVFAQAVNFGEAENTSGVALDFSTPTTFDLTVANSQYSLEADGVEVLSGDLRNYNFDPATSNPPLPASANPYEISNLLFFGDNTDQAHAEFTLGTITVSPLADTGEENSPAVPFFSYEQFLRFQNPAAVAPADQIDGLPIAQLFDEGYYLAQNTDVANAVSAGILSSGYQHFVQFGLGEGRDPSSLYDEAFYLSTNTDVAQAVTAGILGSGLEHFLQFGHEEGRDPSTLFSQADYLTTNPDVGNAVNNGFFQSAFEHYIEFGIDESRLPQLSLYNEAYYLQNNPDVATAVAGGIFTDGFQHYVSFGQQELSRNPSALFDESDYLTLHTDVAAAVNGGFFASGFSHYVQFGRFENRQAIA